MESKNYNSYKSFENISLNALNIYAPLKLKELRFKSSAFITKKLRKKLWKYQNQKITLIRIEIMKIDVNIKPKETAAWNFSENQKSNNVTDNVNDVTDNKSFRKSVKPYFSNKGSDSNKITPVENDVIITNDRVLWKTMNKFFINTTKKLNIIPFKNSSDTDINQITSFFKNHVSIRKIQEYFLHIEANDFNFRQLYLKEVKLEILNLNIKKSSTT